MSFKRAKEKKKSCFSWYATTAFSARYRNTPPDSLLHKNNRMWRDRFRVTRRMIYAAATSRANRGATRGIQRSRANRRHRMRRTSPGSDPTRGGKRDTLSPCTLHRRNTAVVPYTRARIDRRQGWRSHELRAADLPPLFGDREVWNDIITTIRFLGAAKTRMTRVLWHRPFPPLAGIVARREKIYRPRNGGWRGGMREDKKNKEEERKTKIESCARVSEKNAIFKVRRDTNRKNTAVDRIRISEESKKKKIIENLTFTHTVSNRFVLLFFFNWTLSWEFNPFRYIYFSVRIRWPLALVLLAAAAAQSRKLK